MSKVGPKILSANGECLLKIKGGCETIGGEEKFTQRREKVLKAQRKQASPSICWTLHSSLYVFAWGAWREVFDSFRRAKFPAALQAKPKGLMEANYDRSKAFHS